MNQNKKCNNCGGTLEYSKLLECLRCPTCTDKKLVEEFFMSQMLKLMQDQEEDSKND